MHARAAPLYDERKAVVTGEKDAPAGEEAAAPKPAEGGAAAAAAEPKQAGEPEEEAPPGIPDFWLSAMRANPVLAEHVRPNPNPYCAYAACMGCHEHWCTQACVRWVRARSTGWMRHCTPISGSMCGECLGLDERE